jgi:hypothetical protein
VSSFRNSWRDALAESVLDPTPARVAPSTQKAVGQRLARYLNVDDEAWPGIARLGRETSFSERSVEKALTALVANRFLEVVAEGGLGAGSTTRYRAVIAGRANDVRASRANLLPGRAHLTPDKGERPSPEDVIEDKEQSGGARLNGAAAPPRTDEERRLRSARALVENVGAQLLEHGLREELEQRGLSGAALEELLERGRQLRATAGEAA